MGDATAALRRVAALGLPGPGPDPTRVDEADWPVFRSRVAGQRITGLAVEAVATGSLELPEVHRHELEAMHREEMLWALTVERRLLRVAAALDAAGVLFVVLKGPALAHTIYPEPCLRSFGDVDVLVSTSDWRTACEVLQGSGLRRQRPEPRRGFDERFGKASVHKGDDAVEVDLHRTLVLGPFGLWLQPEELLARTETFQVGGRALRRLDDTGLLLNACVHASLGWRPPRLVPLRDVLQVAWYGVVDWDRLATWATRWRLTAVLQHAFGTASERLGAPLPDEAVVFVQVSPARAELRALEAYTESRRHEGATALGTVRAIPGISGKAAYALALAFPRRDFLVARARYGERPSYLRRLAIPMRWGRSRGGGRGRANAVTVDGAGATDAGQAGLGSG